MEQNKQLAWWIGSIMFCASVIVVGVFAHDRGIDQAIVDHLFDFHFDPQEALEADRQRYDAQKRSDDVKKENHEKFCDEVQNWWKDADDAFSSSDRGTYSPPENNGCRD